MKPMIAVIGSITLSIATFAVASEPSSNDDAQTNQREELTTLHTMEALDIKGHDGVAVASPNAFDIISRNDDLLEFYVYDDDRAQTILSIPADYILSPTGTQGGDKTVAGIPFTIESAPSPDQAVIRVSQYTSDEIEATFVALEDYLKANILSGSMEYDGWTDTIVLAGDSTIKASDIPATTVPVVIEVAEVSALVYNFGMVAPFKGGGAIYDMNNSRCTSGIPAYNAKGSPGYFTAGHCFSSGGYVHSKDTSKAGRYYTGTVSHTFGYPTVDAQFVSGTSYNGKILASTSLNSAKPVIGVYRPEVSASNRVCFTGSTTGTKCNNHVTGYNGRYCDKGICHEKLMTIKGGTSAQKGDSGGPVFANFGSDVKVTGIISGLRNPIIGNSTTYVETWSRIADSYNARLMVG